jgi:Homeodomain-like domain-containing protein
MSEITALFQQWHWDERGVRERMYRAPNPRERERWHALWLLARGWPTAQVADALDRDPPTIGQWLANFRQAGPRGLAFEQTGGSPPRSLRTSRPS